MHLSKVADDGPKHAGVNYSPMDPTVIIPSIVSQFQNHAALVWVVVPSFVFVQALIPQLQPSCESGFSNYGLIVVGLVVAHHLHSESRAWTAAKALLAPRELAVMRQLGVLSDRRQLVALGILEDLHLYVDLVFPLLARSCDPALPVQWVQGWHDIPFLGQLITKVVEHLRFWGCAAILVAGINLAGLLAFAKLARGQVTTSSGSLYADRDKATPSGALPRLAGEVFFSLAHFSEIAKMPSVAHLFEEMGLQRRWNFDPKSGGAKSVMHVREEIALGKLTEDILQEYELHDHQEFERVNSAGTYFWLATLAGKVLVWNGLQLWVQVSFLELSFERLGRVALLNVLVGVAMSGVHILGRSARLAPRLGCWGFILALLSVMVVTWAASKIFFTFHCQAHQWNLVTGCLASKA